MKQEKEVLTMIKLEDRKMTKQLQEFHTKVIWVTDFDEEDWRELLRQDQWEPFEHGKALLRVE